MHRESRIKLLKRIAKKKALEPLKGKKSKKDVQKAYLAAKKLYDNVAADLRKAKEQQRKLQSFIDENEADVNNARETMRKCSDLLRNMDMANASDVRIGRNPNDIAYSCDGKWCNYNADTNDVKPYKKSQPESQDVQDADTIPEDKEYEGFDVGPGEGVKL